MRTLIIGLIAVFWFGLAIAAPPKKVVLVVENFTCPACSLTIAMALKKVPGVSGQHIDAKTATVTVTYDPAKTTVAAVSRAITDAGFPAKEKSKS